ncbi:conserved hypothetical protein [Streptomyces misionensis JCM 4497]
MRERAFPAHHLRGEHYGGFRRGGMGACLRGRASGELRPTV